MPTLYSQFIEHYTSTAKEFSFRRIYEDAWEGIDRASEVSAIRSFLLANDVGVDYLNKTVSRSLSNGIFNIKFASIFCHQKPRINRTANNQSRNPGDTPSCELGDLFVAFVLLDGQDKLHYFSGALFQAKLYAKLDSLSQKYLYDYDTDFEVPKYLANRLTSAQNTRKMPTYDEGRGRGFRYLILNPAEDKTAIRARHCPWNHNYQLRWSTFLDGVLAGTDGLRAFLDSSSPSAWDIITSDLLYTGLNIPSRKPPRGNNIAIQVATSLFNNFTNLSDSSAIADKEIFGIPTLMIIAQAPDYKSQND